MTIETSRRDALSLMAAATAGGIAPSALLAATGTGAVIPDDLRIDRRVAPSGFDTQRPRFGWILAARDPAARSLAQSAAQVVVSGSDSEAVFDSGKVAGSETAITPARILALPPQTPLQWRVRVWDQAGHASPWSAPARCVTGAATPWRGRWIAAEPDGPITATPLEAAIPPSSAYVLPLLRRAFRIDRPVRHAVVCLSGLGAHALSVNGRAASDTLLDPGWTDYCKTVLYETIDITGLLRVGENMLGVRLGGGMYDVATVPGRYAKFVGSFGAPKLMLQLRIVHDDGTERWIVSDTDWRTRAGPVTFASVYAGEDHDARREPVGWDETGAGEDRGWRPVLITNDPGGALRSQAMPGLRPVETIRTVAVTRPAPGIAVHDLGRNFAGRPVLTVRGAPGTTIRITPGELLDANGLVTQTSMGASAAHAIRFAYTLDDRPGDQVWTPRFCYTGFRYLEVEGGDVVALDGEFVRADLPVSGTFLCSDRQITAVHDMIRQAALSNVATVLTDCPHREKLGWLEESWLSAATIFHTVEALPLYAKMIDDIVDAQRGDGMVPSIAPEYIRFVDGYGRDTDFRDSPEWGSAVVQSPWAAYRFTGDIAILARAYPAMQRYMAYLRTRAKDGLLDFGLGDWYDIGPAPPGPAQLTTRAFTATAVWHADLIALAQIAGRLGHGDDANRFGHEAAGVRERINARFLDPATARYDRDSQTASAMALVLGIVPAGLEPRVLDRLIAAIHARRDHVSAGDIGFHYVVRALWEGGRSDLLATMLSKTDTPSYGGQLRAGATALTEAWDANPTSSQNHFMLGHAMQWLYAGLAGIDLDFARGSDDALLIAPQPVPGMASAAATFATTLGMIRSRWRIADGMFALDLTVPPGATARIRLPTNDPASIRDGTRRIAGDRDIAVVARRADHVELRVRSGLYRLRAAYPAA